MHPSGNRIRARRQALPGRKGRALSQQALSDRVGVTLSTVQKWEREGFPHADLLAQLATALGVSADWIVVGHALPQADGAEVAVAGLSPAEDSAEEAAAEDAADALEGPPSAEALPRKARKARPGRQGHAA